MNVNQNCKGVKFMKQFLFSLLIMVVLAGCSSPTPIPTPTPIPPTPTPTPPKAVDLFMRKTQMSQEEAIDALGVLNSIGVKDISRLDFEKDDIPGKWYLTDFVGFKNAKIYINSNQKVYRVTDSTGDMFFYNGFKNGVEEIVTDFILYDNEKQHFIKLAIGYVPQGLKAPSTASFPDTTSGYWKVSRFGDYVQIEAWVDAENSFGAMLRNDFLAQIDYTNYDLLYLTIEGDWLFGERQHWQND